MRQRVAVDVGDRLHLADGRREERLVGIGRARRSAARPPRTRVEARGRARSRARASRRAGSRSTPAVCAARRRARRTRWSRWPRRARRACSGRWLRPRRRSCAYASARTFSAYEIVFRPAVAPRSLRTHGTTTTVMVDATDTHLARRDDRRSATASRRSEPSGCTPPVTVIRSRASASPFGLAAPPRAASNSCRPVGRVEPEPAAPSARAGRGAVARRTGARRRRATSRRRRRPRGARGRRARPAASSPVGEPAVDPERAHDGTSVPGAGDREQARRLQLGLGPLGGRRRVGDDARADAELGAVVEDRERADRDREVAFAALRCRSNRTRRSTRRGGPARALRWLAARAVSARR